MKNNRELIKKITTLTLAFNMMLGGVCQSVQANDNISVTLNGIEIDCSQQPAVNISGRVLVPLRAIFEALGADVNWDNSLQLVTAETSDVLFKMIIGEPEYTVNGESAISDVIPQIINGSTMVPVRVVSESLGCEVAWDSNTQTVIISNDSTNNIDNTIDIDNTNIIEEVEETIKLSEEDVYNAIIALKSEYPDGMEWTNSNSYRPLTGYYSSAAGCAGFAHLLSDAAFGKLPERRLTEFDEFKVGDIVRINNDTHSVCVLSVENDTVTIVEGNINSSIKWGRQYSLEKFNSVANYIIRRYPE